MPTRGSRWSLLAAMLVFGIALMHTLGHPAIGNDAMGHGPETSATHREPGVATAVDRLFAASYPDIMSAVPVTRAVHPTTPSPHGMDPSLMCLAVLTALLALVAAIVRYRRRTRPDRPVDGSRAGGRAARGPPSPRAGRTLATLSVLRI